MNRRKFLSVGGIGLLGVNSLVYGMSPNLFETGEGLAATFITWLEGREMASEKTKIFIKKIPDSIRDLRAIGYQLNKPAFYSTGNYNLASLTLKDKQVILDEVLIIFNESENVQRTGSLNAQQINWCLANAEKINSLATESNGNIEDWVLPASSKRFLENGISYFPTRKGKVGFRTDIGQAGATIQGSILDVNGNTLIEDRLSTAGFYPDNDYML